MGFVVVYNSKSEVTEKSLFSPPVAPFQNSSFLNAFLFYDLTCKRIPLYARNRFSNLVPALQLYSFIEFYKQNAGPVQQMTQKPVKMHQGQFTLKNIK